MTIDELADTVARRIRAEQEVKQLILRTRELERALYHDEGLTARRIRQDTVRILQMAGFSAVQTLGMGLSEDAIRKVVGRRAT